MKFFISELIFLFAQTFTIIVVQGETLQTTMSPKAGQQDIAFKYMKNETRCRKSDTEPRWMRAASGQGCDDSKTLCLIKRYSTQPTKAFQYHNVCGIQFFELFKLPLDEEMMLFGSVYNGVKSKPDFQLLKLAAMELGIVDITYRLVVRLQHNYPQLYFPITLNNVSYEIKVNRTPNAVTEYLIPVNLKYNPRTLSNLRLMGEPKKYVNTSYVIFCLNSAEPKSNCAVVQRNHKIYCYCHANDKGIIMVGVEMFFIWFIMLVCMGIYLASMSESTNVGPEVQANMQLCMPGRSTHDYLAIVRVGPATHGFNYERAHIDIQLLNGEDEPVGVPIRYSSVNLQNQVSSELHMLICRMSPIPDIHALRVNHSDPLHLLHLQDFTLVNLHQSNLVEKQLIFNWYITCEPTVFRPRVILPNEGEGQLTIPIETYSREWISLLSTWCLNGGEKMSICIFLVGFLSYLMMAARTYLNFYEFWKEMGKSMGDFLGYMLLIMLVALAMVFTFELLYLRYIKRSFLIESYMQITADQYQTLCHYSFIRMTVLVMLVLGGLIFSGFTVYLSTKLSVVAALLWSGTALSTIALTIGVWLFLDDIYFVPWYSASPVHEYMRNPAHQQLKSTPSPTANLQHPSIASAFFPLPPSALGLSRVASSTVSNYGPKLVNPKFGQKSSKINSELYLKLVEIQQKSQPIIMKAPIKTATTALTKPSKSHDNLAASGVSPSQLFNSSHSGSPLQSSQLSVSTDPTKIQSGPTSNKPPKTIVKTGLTEKSVISKRSLSSHNDSPHNMHDKQ